MRVLYLDIDTTRPDHLSCYGYPRETTPNLNRIAADAVRFDNCYVSDAPCLPSRASSWTGRFGIHSGIINHGGTRADPIPVSEHRPFQYQQNRYSFPQAMHRAGMYPVSFSPFAERHSAFWFYHGFREIVNPGKGGNERADEVIPAAMDWLDRNQDRDNWFLHVNVWDPHTLFRTPMEEGEPFESAPAPDWLSDERLEHLWNLYGPHSAREVPGNEPTEFKDLPRTVPQIRTREEYIKWINGYDTGIWYADLWIGKLLAKLEEQGILDETAILVTSDHGENHGELGVYGDHQTADHITSRVPYLLKWPGVTDGGRVDTGLHYQTDIHATVLNLLGIDVPSSWDGVSFADAVKNGSEDGRDDLVVSNNAWSCQRSVRWDKWMLIRTYHTGYKPFPAYMLFDLEADPHETTNLAEAKPEIVAEGVKRLEAWHEEMMRTADSHHDPMWEVMAQGGPEHANDNNPGTKRYLDRLRETERGWYADWLEENEGRPIPADAPWSAAPLPGAELLKAPYEGK